MLCKSLNWIFWDEPLPGDNGSSLIDLPSESEGLETAGVADTFWVAADVVETALFETDEDGSARDPGVVLCTLDVL